MPPQQSEFRVWSCLGRSLSILGRNFVPFYTLAVLITAFPVLYDLWLGAASVDPASTDPRSAGWVVLDVVVGILGFVLIYLLSAAIIYGTTQELRGRHAGIGACLRRGLPLIWPTFLAAILVGIAVTLGAVLLIIPGIIIFIMYWLVIPVVVMERPGVTASFTRSAQLTKGVRWRLFGIVVILFVVGVGAQFIVIFATGMSYISAASHQGPIIGVIVFFLVNALASAFYAVVNAVAYYDIRQSKEGIEIDQIAAVFD